MDVGLDITRIHLKLFEFRTGGVASTDRAPVMLAIKLNRFYGN